MPRQTSTRAGAPQQQQTVAALTAALASAPAAPVPGAHTAAWLRALCDGSSSSMAALPPLLAAHQQQQQPSQQQQQPSQQQQQQQQHTTQQQAAVDAGHIAPVVRHNAYRCAARARGCGVAAQQPRALTLG
jgi:hypothetical protein